MTGDKLYQLDYGSFIGSRTGYAGLRLRLCMRSFTTLIGPRGGERVLEIGCNDGALVERLVALGADAVGIDVNAEVIARAKSPRLQVMSALDLRFPDGHFDKVCAFEVLEHIEELPAALSEVHRVLRQGGRLYVSFPVELVRGQAALLDALCVYGNPLWARRLHVHLLTPARVRRLCAGVPLVQERWSVRLLPWPSFVMVLRKE